MTNSNSLLFPEHTYYYPYAIGMKTGFTSEAKNCLITASKKGDLELISIVLHAEQTEDGKSARYYDTINLLEYGNNNYTPHYTEEINETDIDSQELTEEQELIMSNKKANNSQLTGFYIFASTGMLIVLVLVFEANKYLLKKDGIRYWNP